MDLLTMHGTFSQWVFAEREESLPVMVHAETDQGQVEVWPAAATAAVILSGADLADIKTDDDLRECLETFGVHLDIDATSEQEWREATEKVIAAVMLWGEAHDPQLPEPSWN